MTACGAMVRGSEHEMSEPRVRYSCRIPLHFFSYPTLQMGLFSVLGDGKTVSLVKQPWKRIWKTINFSVGLLFLWSQLRLVRINLYYKNIVLASFLFLYCSFSFLNSDFLLVFHSSQFLLLFIQILRFFFLSKIRNKGNFRETNTRIQFYFSDLIFLW